jgi:hypothetical protein
MALVEWSRESRRALPEMLGHDDRHYERQFMPTDETDAATIKELEEHLLRPEFRCSAEWVAELLAEEFVEFGSSGRISDKQTTESASHSHFPGELSILFWVMTIHDKQHSPGWLSAQDLRATRQPAVVRS